jgi:hypothetical protein
MSIRFGGIGGALRRANSAGHLAVTPIGENILTHLHLTYGRRELPADADPVAGVLWWIGLSILSAVALLHLIDRPRRPAALLPFLATAALALEYFVLVPIVAPRFLLPAYALASLTAAIGLVWVLNRGVAGRVIGTILLVLTVPWALWQLDVGRRVNDGQWRRAERPYQAGLLLRDLAGDRPCSFVSPGGYPRVQIASECSGGKLVSKEPTPAQLAAASSGEEVFIILPGRARPPSPLASLQPTRFRSTKRTWFIYQLSQPPP